MKTIGLIPVYNEETKIQDVISETLHFVDEVIVCDDGSTDNSASVSSKAGATVLKHEKNLGKGAALKSLFETLKDKTFDYAVTIDGDGQFLPNEIPKLLNLAKKKDLDIVIGYRFDNSEEMPTYRKFGNKMLDKITNLASELPFRDTQSGFRVYNKKAIDTITFQTNGFAADAEILIDASKKGLKIDEEKISVLYDTGSKTSTKNPISHSSEVLGSLIELIALKRPLMFLGLPGIVLLIIGSIFSIIVISIFNDTRYFSIPSTLVALGTILVGLLLILMSIVLFSINRSLNRRTN